MFIALGASIVNAQQGQPAWLEDLLLIVVVFLTAGGEWIGLGRLRRHWASQEPEVPALPEVSTS
jgi:hypothetical protein